MQIEIFAILNKKENILDISLITAMFPLLLKGLKYNILIALIGIVFGFIIGCFAGFALQCKNKFLKAISYFYIWIIRGTPLIVQALYIYFVIPKTFNISLAIMSNGEVLVSESVMAGIIAITINSGAFFAEIVRSALESVDKGQWDAGKALGLSYVQILFHIIVPIAMRNIMPALFNQFIISVKDTSILTIIVVPEITHQMQNYAITTFQTIPAYTFGALFYLSIISILMIIQKFIEKKLKLSSNGKIRGGNKVAKN